MEVRYEHLMPREADDAMAQCPTLFIPLGTIEWHGLHNLIGLDALKAHALCVQAAQQGGGLVHPPVYGGVGGLEEPHTFIVDPNFSTEAYLVKSWLERLCREACRNGFRAVIILTGHYGAGQQIAVRETAVRMTRALGIPVLGVAEFWLAMDQGYYGDHAAFFETSIMMHLFPGRVDLGRLGKEPHQGVGGKDPKQYATAEDGKRFCDTIVDRLAALACSMPGWDEEKRLAFVRAEAAIVNRQLELAGSSEAVWTAWRNIPKGLMDSYGEYVVSGQFDRIAPLADAL